MIVQVHRCWGGGSKHYYALEWAQSRCSRVRDRIRCDEGEHWNRRLAAAALDLLERVYGKPRANIRFRVQ